MSNTAANELGVYSSQNSLKGYVAKRLAATGELGQRALFGAKEAVTGFIERRKSAIALGLGTVAMTGGLAFVLMEGAVAAENSVEDFGEQVYAQIAPQSSVDAMRAEAPEPAGSAESIVQMAAAAAPGDSLATGSLAAAGIALLSVGTAANVYGMRGIARRRRKEDPMWVLDQPVADVGYAPGESSGGIGILDDMFDQQYKPPIIEKLTHVHFIHHLLDGALAPSVFCSL